MLARGGRRSTTTQPLQDLLPLGFAGCIGGKGLGFPHDSVHEMYVRSKRVRRFFSLHRFFWADESGEYLGQQVWNQDVLKETQGVFLLTTVRVALAEQNNAY